MSNMSDTNPNQKTPQVVVGTKNVGLSIILTVLFGPLGMFYSTIIGAVIMIIVSTIVGVATLGVGLAITWPISVVWGALAAVNFNKRALARG